MATSPPCPECKRGLIVWRTRTAGVQPVDVFICDLCDYVLAEEDWHVPVASPKPGTCRNCGGARFDAVCTDCGLSTSEDLQVHNELRQLIAPKGDNLEAAVAAIEGGRKLLALKLATAAAHELHHCNEGWALRVSLLLQLEMPDAAVADCKDWTQGPGGQLAVAWALYGDAMRATGQGPRSLELYERALSINPALHDVRTRMAETLLNMGRYGMGKNAAMTTIMEAPADSDAAHRCLELMGFYASRLLVQGDVVAVYALLDELGEKAEEGGTLMLTVAWAAFQRGDAKEVKRALKRAGELDADPQLLSDAEAALSPRKRRGWCPWGRQ